MAIMKVMIAYYRYIYILEADGNYAKDYSSFASDHHYYHHKVDHDYVDRHRGLVWQ